MHKNHQATKYFIKFQQLATHVRWGNAALRWQAYNGLAKCIKNNMVHHGKPNTLVSLRGLAQAIDTCYWECKAEIACETGNPGPSVTKPDSKPDQKPDSHPSNMLQSKTNSSLMQNKGSTTEQKEPTSNALPKLGKDGKLTPQERQHCMDNKLCLFCGTAGHIVKDCAKAASSKA